MDWSSQIYAQGSSFFRQNVKNVCVCTSGILITDSVAKAKGTSSTGTSLAVSSSAAASDFTYSTSDNPGSGGHKLTVSAFSTILCHDGGAAARIAFTEVIGVGSTGKILYIADCTTQSLSSGNAVTVPSFDIMDIAGPTSS